ncbi:MAG TPA: hypothetical protein PLL76_11160 [Thermoanaerobaculia bacterium]|mgnify:FL=1|nr:hypothetical protein [Thermoanaerobaculia bacterium]HQP86807.1 hypothetical protein [Thermoanaerobaculia bacterium]
MPPRTVPARPRPARGALLAVTAALLLSADDRHAGKVSDGRQTIGTAVAIVETGELGIGKGAPRAFGREADAVSRYGLGASLAQLPAAAFAPAVESAFGPGTSQPLFLLAPLAGVLLAAAAAGGIARLAGASTSLQGLAILLASLGGPLGSYATSDFSEALQAAALAGALLFAFGAAREDDPRASRRRAFAAGLAAGAALLVKSSLVAASPLLLLPLLAASALRGRRLAAAAAGAILPVAAWAAFELHRFGRLFSGYEGEGFTHPLPEGLWRLLVGPNRGLVLFFPAALLAAAGLARAARRPGDTPLRLAAAGSALAFLALLGTAAAWWAWHGVGGWGPRLLVPAVPLLAPWAALAAEGLGTGGRRAVAVLSVALNLPPLLVHPSLVDTYVANCRRAPLTPELEREVPALAVGPDDAGRPSVSPENVLAKEPLASPFLLYPWYAAASAPRSAEGRAERLARPPWYETRPGLGPRLVPFPPELADVVAPPLGWSFFGRALGRGIADPASFSVYLAALSEQVGRAHETGRLERGLELARKLARLDPGEGSDALLLESLRLLRRTEALRAAFASLPEERVSGPSVLVVRALAARDAGDLPLAARLGEAVAPYFPGTALARDAARPSSWPATFAALTRPLAPSA